MVTSTMTDAGDPPAASANATAFKIPTFWPADPDLWFAQVEAQFSTHGITVEKTKYDHIAIALASDTATFVRVLILSAPVNTPYATLKAALIKSTVGSNQQKLQRLLTGVELGDQKPSQLLCRMRQLWNDDMGEPLLRELFLQRLPANVRMVSIQPPPLMSWQTADRVMEVSVPVISAVGSNPCASTTAEIESLCSEVRKLQERMTTMSVHAQSSRHRSLTPLCRRSPSPARSVHSRSPGSGDHTLCWYHKRFGESATKCVAPCLYQGNDQASR